MYKRKVEDVGCTVFLIDSGVDTGDIVAQERLPVEKGDSFMTLAWKGMIRIAQLQAQALSNLDRGIELPGVKSRPYRLTPSLITPPLDNFCDID